jgi:A/G-specific adenine glycosylase
VKSGVTPGPTAIAAPEAARALARWYAAEHRALPWRETRDPYRIWLSEIMLQQTRVATVLPYYERFTSRYPTVEALAEAPRDELLKAWEGLGYYARCRNLQAAARRVVADHGGRFPQTLEGVEALPGVGRSTAHAILCFSAGKRLAVLDGNVVRVVARLFDIDGDVTRADTRRELWRCAEALIAGADEPATHNQAMMELGATLCARKSPRCEDCPLADRCLARAAGTQAERPVKPRKAPTPHYDLGAAVVLEAGRVLICRRPSDGLLGGLWEFPCGNAEPEEPVESAAARHCDARTGVAVGRLGEVIARVPHAFSHFRITLHAFWAAPARGSVMAERDDVRWVDAADLDAYAFPKAAAVVRAEVLRALEVAP